MNPTASGSPRQIQWLTSFLLILLFLCGIATGIGLTRHLSGQAPAQHRPPPPPPHPLTGFALTEAQHDTIEEIYTKYQPQIDSILQETYPRLREVYDKIDQEIRELLTPEQQKQMDSNRRWRQGPPRSGMRHDRDFFGPPMHHGPPGSLPPPR